jgi:hypothetical protein
MSNSSGDEPFFLPAESIAEAIARIYSLTGADDKGTRGEKRAILALRDALGLDIDTARTNAVMAEQIADALGIAWYAPYQVRNTLTLAGLNALLEAASSEYYQGSLRRLVGLRPPGLDHPRWADFRPAHSKIEAVNRISMLTASGAEWLGPGSKEHKRVLINLAHNLAPSIDTSLTKSKLGRALAAEFGAPWSDVCESTGETISLAGLNILLAGAELRLDRFSGARSDLFGTPEQEGAGLAAALLDGWRPLRYPDGGTRVVWDGRTAIQWMFGNEISEGPNQNEWQGFYWESRGRALLNSAFSPNPNPPTSKYGNTSFDYSLRFVWDLKAHTEAWLYPSVGVRTKAAGTAPLNDQVAMDACIEEQGLGFLMVGGVGHADEDGSFVAWHREFKKSQGKKERPSNSGNSTMRKSAFEPLHVEAFFFPDIDALNAAKAGGHITGYKQGSQSPTKTGACGKSRRPKYNLNVPKARSTYSVARFNWPVRDA